MHWIYILPVFTSMHGVEVVSLCQAELFISLYLLEYSSYWFHSFQNCRSHCLSFHHNAFYTSYCVFATNVFASFDTKFQLTSWEWKVIIIIFRVWLLKRKLAQHYQGYWIDSHVKPSKSTYTGYENN